MITLNNITKSFDGTEVLKGISMAFETGKNQSYHRAKWFWKNGVA